MSITNMYNNIIKNYNEILILISDRLFILYYKFFKRFDKRLVSRRIWGRI